MTATFGRRTIPVPAAETVTSDGLMDADKMQQAAEPVNASDERTPDYGDIQRDKIYQDQVDQQAPAAQDFNIRVRHR